MNGLLSPPRLSGIPAIVIVAALLWSCWACGGTSSTGNRTSTTQHAVDLSWTASTSSVAGYKIYRGTQHFGPYAPLSSSPQAGTTFTDSTVQSGATYYYVVTAVDAHSQESGYSNEVQAVIPSP